MSTVTTDNYSMVKIALYTPVCTQVGEKIALSRKISRNWRLIGWGTIQSGKKIYGEDEGAEEEKDEEDSKETQ